MLFFFHKHCRAFLMTLLGLDVGSLNGLLTLGSSVVLRAYHLHFSSSFDVSQRQAR
jgi:hypothetical protein